jgi:hypothetical protein
MSRVRPIVTYTSITKGQPKLRERVRGSIVRNRVNSAFGQAVSKKQGEDDS